MVRVDLGLVVTTLGRVDPLERLLESLHGQLEAGDRLVIVAQERAPEIEALASAHRGPDLAITVTTSGRGASLGRNTGVAHLGTGDFLLLFPNDTTWFPAGSIASLRERADDMNAGALTVIDENGPKFTLPDPDTALDRWNVWSVIEMGLVMRRSVFDELGGFDAGIGTGAQTPWQAGEATDLLLRLLARRPDLAGRFCWLPDDVTVGGVADARGLSTSERRRKLRAYGRGLGRLVMRHPYPWWWRSAFVGGGLAFGLRHRATNSIADGWWVFLGRAEGALGRTIGTARAAVSR